MMWYEHDRSDPVVWSTRIRLAANLNKTPFPARLTSVGREEVAEKIKAVFEGDKDWQIITVSRLTPVERTAFTEAHMASPAFMQGDLAGRLLILSSDGECAVMVNEEDHVRLQCIRAGYCPEEAYERALQVFLRMEKELGFAFDDELGYLTHCPTNLGTGMRASLMMHLPALTRTQKSTSLSSALSKAGFTLRGLYGEGSMPGGGIYQLSNQICRGFSEAELIGRLMKIAEQVVRMENDARKALKEKDTVALEDRVYRALGVLRYARTLSSKEMYALISDVRMGAAIGLIDAVALPKLDRLLIDMLPARLILINGEADNPSMRDKIRADMTRAALKEVNE